MNWTRYLARRPNAQLLTPDEAVSPSPDAPRAVIIGAGFGGLAAAVRLLARGFCVTILDRLNQPGGRARVFRQDGFTFDAGPTVITAPFLFEELWELLGHRLADDVDLVPVSPFYRVRFGNGDVFNYTGDAAAMRKEVHRFAPEDVQGYERFVRKSEEIFEVGFEELGHVPFGRLRDMLKIAPAMMRLGSYRSVYGMVSRYISDERLRQVFSFHPLLVGGNPFSTTSIYALILFLERKWGVHYAMGGTGALVSGLTNLIEQHGGALRLDADVREITLDRGRASGVRLANGEHVEADLVVSNADVIATYRDLLPDGKAPRAQRRLRGAQHSMSLFVWYFGTCRTYDEVAHHTILLGPRYEELLDDIFHRKTLASDFSLYVHRPTATDPAMAPEGCDAFYVLSPVPHLGSGDVWDDAQSERYRKKIEQRLSETILPGLEGEIVTSRTFTPKGFLEDYRSVKGAAFSLEPVLTQSAYFRPHNKSDDVDNLYLVGAGTHPGAGLPGVLSSARVLDTVIPDPERY